MSTMEFNKLFGAVTAALLIYLLANFVSEQVYSLDEPQQLAYALEIESDEDDAAEEVAETPLPVLLASASVDDGAKVFRKCSACHKLEDGANAVGPHLWGVVGREVGAVADYGYSGALNEQADEWTFANLNAFLENPKGWAPGTSMGFAGLNKPEDRAAVIAYLNEEGGSNLPYPEPEADAAEAEPEAETDTAEADITATEAEMAAEGVAGSGAAATDMAEADTAESQAIETEEGEVVAAAEPAEPVDDGAGVESAGGPAPAAEAEDMAAANEERRAADAEGMEMAAAAPEGADAAEVKEATAEARAESLTEGQSAPEPAPELTFEEALAQADVSYGEELFQACSACHMLAPGMHGIGPSLAGVIGRDIAGAEGYPYSDALSAVEGDWTLARLNVYLEDPQAAVQGVKMGFKGLERQVDRAAVIAYLNTQMETPASTEIDADAPAALTAPDEDKAEAPAPEAGTETEMAEAEAKPVEEAAAETPATEETAAAEPAEPAAEETAAAEPAEPAAEETAAAEPAEAATEETADAEPAEPAEEAEPAMEMAAAAPAEEPAEAPAPAAAPSVDPEFVAAYTAAEVKAGEKVFRQCKACHVLAEGKNAVGPSLWNVVGRPIGAVDGFKYSDALSSHGGEWGFEELNAYLENPKDYIPGNRMGYRGLRKLEDRAAVIKYLNEEGGSNVAIQ